MIFHFTLVTFLSPIIAIFRKNLNLLAIRVLRHLLNLYHLNFPSFTAISRKMNKF